MTAIEAELEKLDARQAVQWLYPQYKCLTKPIPFILNVEYKRNTKGEIISHKPRFALQGDMMVPSVHFDPTQTSVPMADKHTVRIVTSKAAERGWPLEHMDMASAYIHTKFKYDKDVFLREPSREKW